MLNVNFMQIYIVKRYKPQNSINFYHILLTNVSAQKIRRAL